MFAANFAPKNIVVRNVNYAMYEFMHWLRVAGVEENSRNGPVLVSPGPVCTLYQDPRQRVLFNPHRDANPFFHLFESLWMLGGSADVGYLTQFNKRMVDYSDDGQVLHGAYGYRWINHFSFDQLDSIAYVLKKDPSSRRAVLAMWDPSADLAAVTKDLPCNTHIYFDLRQGALNMTVCNRSNDMLWGAYGANAVHFSMLQEYLANLLGAPVGFYYQFSNNAHVYLETAGDPRAEVSRVANPYDFYDHMGLNTYPYLIAPHEQTQAWYDDLYDFLNRGTSLWVPRTLFFGEVARPMLRVWEARKEDPAVVTKLLEDVKADDWRTASAQWINRRAQKKNTEA